MLATATGEAWFAGDHAALRRAAGLLETLAPDVDAALGTVIGAVSGMGRLVADEPAAGLALCAPPSRRTAVPVPPKTRSSGRTPCSARS
jgi:hypothetical protein